MTAGPFIAKHLKGWYTFFSADNKAGKGLYIH